jgi:hypothetical protein
MKVMIFSEGMERGEIVLRLTDGESPKDSGIIPIDEAVKRSKLGARQALWRFCFVCKAKIKRCRGMRPDRCYH